MGCPRGEVDERRWDGYLSAGRPAPGRDPYQSPSREYRPHASPAVLPSCSRPRFHPPLRSPPRSSPSQRPVVDPEDWYGCDLHPPLLSSHGGLAALAGLGSRQGAVEKSFLPVVPQLLLALPRGHVPWPCCRGSPVAVDGCDSSALCRVAGLASAVDLRLRCCPLEPAALCSKLSSSPSPAVVAPSLDSHVARMALSCRLGFAPTVFVR